MAFPPLLPLYVSKFSTVSGKVVYPPPPLTQSNSLFLENQIINTTRGTKPNRRWVFQIVFLCQTAFFRCHYFGKAFSLCALEKTLDPSQDTLAWETRGLQTKTIFSEIMTRKNSLTFMPHQLTRFKEIRER